MKVLVVIGLLQAFFAAAQTCSSGGVTGSCAYSCPGWTVTGLCPGAANYVCCLQATCTANGVQGACKPTTSCTGTSTPGLCPGPTNVQCCTTQSITQRPTAFPTFQQVFPTFRPTPFPTFQQVFPTPRPTPFPTFQQVFPTPFPTFQPVLPTPRPVNPTFQPVLPTPQPVNPTPFPATQPPVTSCTVNGVAGTCKDVALCTGTSTAGYCPGAANIQCCTTGGSTGSTGGGPTVQDVINARGCSTTPLAGISRQIITQLNCLRPGTFTSLAGQPRITLSAAAAAVPFAQTSLVTALQRATSAAGRTISINSALRSIAQQLALFSWQGSCGITIAASPGRSNHNGGASIDINDYASWINTLQAQGFRWYGDADAVHFDYTAATDVRELSVRAFQTLWNANNPGDMIAVDGQYGPGTEARLKRSPAGGFSSSGCAPPQTVAVVPTPLPPTLRPASPTNPPPPQPASCAKAAVSTLKFNKNGLDLVSHFEGFGGSCYRDSEGIWTIGYGHACHVNSNDGSGCGPGGSCSGTMSRERALQFLQQDIAKFESCVKNAVRVPLNPNQYAALVSFAFNVGCGGFETSTLLSKLNAGTLTNNEAAYQLSRWHSGCTEGLKRRRYAEGVLYASCAADGSFGCTALNCAVSQAYRSCTTCQYCTACGGCTRANLLAANVEICTVPDGAFEMEGSCVEPWECIGTSHPGLCGTLGQECCVSYARDLLVEGEDDVDPGMEAPIRDTRNMTVRYKDEPVSNDPNAGGNPDGGGQVLVSDAASLCGTLPLHLLLFLAASLGSLQL